MALKFFTDFDDEEEVSTEPVIPTDGHKRYMLPDETGKDVPHSRVSTIADSLGADFGIQRSQAEKLARGFVLRPDLYHAACGVVDNEEDFRNVISQALIVGGDTEASNLGTALHAVIERWLKGEPIDSLPEFFRQNILDLETELKIRKIRILPEFVECVVRNRTYGLGGRIDAIAHLEDEDSYVIFDAKRKKDPIQYPHATSTQLGIYANCDVKFDLATRQYVPLPPLRKDFALVAWFRPGPPETAGESTCQILQVDVGRGWWSTRLAMELREWRKAKHLIHPHIAMGHWEASINPDASKVAQELLRKMDQCYQCESLLCPTCRECTSGQCPTATCTCELVSKPGEPEEWKPVDSKAINPDWQIEDDQRQRDAEEVQTVVDRAVESDKITVKLRELLEVPVGAIDEEAEIQELSSLPRTDLQKLITALGSDRVNHYRRQLAEILVELLNEKRPGSAVVKDDPIPKKEPVPDPKTLIQESVINQPPEITVEKVIRWMETAKTKEELKAIYFKATEANGKDWWNNNLYKIGMEHYARIQNAQKSSTPFD
jgi:hypothetical protein